MKHSLQLRLSQHLTLTPQLQQSIRLLQLSTLELNQEIERFLQDNPLLERDDGLREEPLARRRLPATLEFTSPTTPTTARATRKPTPTASDIHGSADTGRAFDEDVQLRRHPQTTTTKRVSAGRRRSTDAARASDFAVIADQISDRDQKLVTLLIDSLDDDGYLHQDLEELAALLPPELEIEVDELQVALRHLQHLDPPGVGARNLGECLKLQLGDAAGNAHRIARKPSKS